MKTLIVVLLLSVCIGWKIDEDLIVGSDTTYVEHVTARIEEAIKNTEKNISPRLRERLLLFRELTERVRENKKNYTIDDWYYGGVSLYFERKYRKAIKYFTKAIKEEPDEYFYYTWRMIAYYKAGKEKKAIKDFREQLNIKLEEKQ